MPACRKPPDVDGLRRVDPDRAGALARRDRIARSKLAGEHLCRVYGEEFGVPFTILRFFSVYGPRQRPDMGIHQFIKSVLSGQPIKLTGDDGLTARITLRLPENLKATIKLVAGREGMSINTWLVRALARAVSTPSTPRRSSNRLTGFGRS